MIDIRSDFKGGPGIFLTRLRREIERRDMSLFDQKHIILSNEYVSTDNIFVSRVDGVNFLKMSSIELSNFLKYRSNKKFSKLSKLNDVLSMLLGRKYEKYLTPGLTKLFFDRMNHSKIKSIEQSNHIVYQSIYSKKAYGHFCPEYKKNKSTIVNNGVDIEQFRPNVKSLDNNSRIEIRGDLKLVFSGVARLWKRAQEIVKILPILKKYIPETKLYFLGDLDIPSKTIINKLIEKNNLKDNVVFLGRINPDDLPYYYSKMDIMVHPAWFDACPNVVVEALSCGVPVICPSSGGTPELVGKAGSIIEEDFNFGFKEFYNIKKIPKINYSKYALEILKIKKHIDFYSKLARERAVAKLDIRKVADKYINIFKEVA